jgi:hypothetical protein
MRHQFGQPSGRREPRYGYFKKNKIKTFNYRTRNLLNTMKIRWADISLPAGFCILLILAVSVTGCTSQNTGTTTPGPVTTPDLVVTTAGVQASAAPSQIPTQVQAAPAAPTGVQTTIAAAQPPDPVSLTINSATQQTKVYTMEPKSGRIFLVLDITVKNNAVEKGFDLSDSSISLSYAKAGTSPETSITSKVRGGLENPIIMPTTIALNDKRTGQVVFSVADGSGRYTINLLDSRGAVAASQAVTLK